MDTTVVCVLKTGDFYNRNTKVNYDSKYPLWLKRQCEKFITIPFKFVCLTDLDSLEGVDTIKLKHNFPGWWSKMELFRPNLFETKNIFYLDLDTVLTGNIDHIIKYNHKFTTLRYISSKNPKTDKIGSGLMAWSVDLSFLYDKFVANSAIYIEEYKTQDKWGDQGFIYHHCKGMQKFQDIFPDQIVSWKFNLNREDPKEHNKIIIFHGTPKPHELFVNWIENL